jgi:filamentous hemagglutinin family protein
VTARARFQLRPLGLALSLALAYASVQALPQGAQVVQGQVQLSMPQPGQGLIQQGSDKAIVNWQSFSIAANESLRIQQPGARSVLLNRVVGGDPSLILGHMQSNGQVFLVNPRGIVFGRGSQVDAGGLVASTLDLSDSAFLAGNYGFSAGPGAGGLQADGRITAADGTVALLAPKLDVGGTLVARRVGLGAASSVTVDIEGDGLVLFNLRNDDDRDVALKFSGNVLADGGSAELRAQARGDAAGQVLNMDGVVRARGLRQQGGRIVIDGGTAGDTWVSGSLDATGDARGGDIGVLGQRVALLDTASLDASGHLGGGSLQVGGGFEGRGTTHNAQRTWIATGARLRADALDEGDGGQVAIWADLRTDVHGLISARGGRLGGNGGFVETSGKQQLNMPGGGVDVSAPRGRAGRWLLDPADLTISNAPDTDPAAIATPFQPTADGWMLNVATLNTALAAGTAVIVKTATGVGTAGEPGDINVKSAIQGSAGGSLTLDAVGSIRFSGAGAITATGGALNVSLLAGGGITGTSIGTSGGTLTATGSGSIDLGQVNSGALTINSGGGSVVLPTGTVTGALDVASGGGDIGQRAGTLGVTGATTLNAGAGAVALGALNSAGLDITTTTGAITLGSGTITGALTATSTSGSIGQAAGGLTVTAATTLGTGAATVTLGSLASAGLGITTANGAVTLGTGTINGTLSVDSGGAAITQVAGGLTVIGSSSLDGGAITLTDANNALRGAVNLAGAATQVGNGGAEALTLGTLATGALTVSTGTGTLTLGAGNVGVLDATTNNGAIAQSGSLTASGAATLHAGSGSITLDSLSAASLSLTSTAGDIRLGSGSITGALTAGTGSTGAITQASGLLAVGGAATLTSATGAITLGSLSSGAFSATTTGGALRLGTGTVSTLDASTGGGAITQAAGGLTASGTTTLDAGTGAITLNLANSLQGTVHLTGGTTQVRNGGAQGLTLGTLSTDALIATTGTGTLTLGSGSVGALTATTSGGNIAQAAGTLSASGLATLNAGTGSILLGGFGSAGLSATTSGSALRLGTGTINGALTAVTAGGAITQAAGGVIVTGHASIDAGSGAITLNHGANDWRGTVALTGGATAITSTASGSTVLNISSLATGALTASTVGGTLTLGAGTVGGTLNANSGGGLLTQTGAGLHVGGAATLTAGTGAIDLTAADNQWNGVTLSGNSLSLASNGALNILGLTQPADSALSLSSTGNLSLGALTDINTGSANLSLTTGGSFTAGGKLAGRNVSVTAQSDLTLGHDITAAETLTLTTSSGGINQTAGVISVTTGMTTVNAGSGSAITLNEANHFGGAVNLTGGVTTLNASGALTLGALNTGNLTVTSNGALDLGSGAVNGTLDASSGGNHAITQASGGLTLSGATTLNAGTAAITLMDAGNDLQGAITATGGAVSLRSADNLHLFSLTQSSPKALVLETVNTLTLPAGTSNINTGSEALTLSTQTGVFTTFGTLTGGNITLRGQSATLAHDITASGALLVETSTGAINQTAGRISAVGTSEFNANGFDITLNRPLNDFQAAVSLDGGAAVVTDQNALSLGGMTVSSLQVQAGGALHLGTGTLTGNLGATAAGAITQEAGGLSVGGTAGFNAGSGAITLTDAGNRFTGAVSLSGGATQLTDTGAVLLAAGDVASLALTSGGAVTQNAGLVVSSGLSVDAGSNAVTLNHTGNQLGGTVALTGGATNLRTTGALTLGTLATGALTLQSNGALNLGQGSIAGNLAAQSGGGAITQTGVLNVTGTTGLQAGSGSVTLTQGGNSWGGALSLAGGATQVHSNGALSLGTLAVGALTLDTTGALGLGQGTVGGALTVDSHGGAITQTGALDVAGASHLQAGAVTLTQAGNRWGGAVRLTTGATQLTGTGALTLGLLSTGNLNVTSSGALNLGQGTVNGDLTATSGGHAIVQAGALQVTGAATVDAGAGNITLANAGNQLLGSLSLTGHAVTLYNQPSLVLGTLSFNSLDATSAGSITLGSGTLSGSLTARALGGAITQIVGGLTVAGDTTLQSSGGIMLDAAGNHFQGLVNLSGGVATLSNAGALRLGSLATSGLTVNALGPLDLGSGSVGGMLTASSGGAITQTGVLAVGGGASLDAGGADITLDQLGNTFGGPLDLRGGTALLRNSGALSLGSLSLGALTVSSGGLQLGTGNIAGALQVDSGGAITQAAGGLAVGGATTLNAGSADITLADGGNALAGLVSVQGGQVSLATRGALRLGAFTARQLTLNAGGDIELGAGSVAGDLSATTRGRRIAQTGAMRVDGTAGFIADGGLVELVLGLPGNQLLGPLQMRGINGGSFASADISSTLDLSFSGDVQTLKLSSGGQLTLGGGSNTTLTAAAVGGIRQTGALRVSGQTTLVANGADLSVDLSQAGNDLTGVSLQAGRGSLGRVQLRDGDAAHNGLKVAGDAGSLEVSSAGALDLLGGRYGSLQADTAATGAAITQTDALLVTGLATLQAGSGSITLTRADNQLPAITVGSAGVATLASAGDYALRASNVSTRLDLAGAGAIRLDGPLSGTGELVMNGSGRLTLQTAQSYSGGTHIRSGTLVLQGPEAQAGSGAVQLGSKGRLDLRDGAALTAGLVVQGGTVLNSAGSGTLAGPVTLRDELRVLTRAPLTRTAHAGLLAGGEGLTISGSIGDGGAGWGLQLDGGGTLTLAAANHYSGSTRVDTGTLRADAAGALPATSAVQLAADARLVLGHDQTAGSLSGVGAVDLGVFTLATGADGRDTRFDGDIGGTGGLTKVGGGRFTLGGRGAHDGATRVATGELVLASANALNERTAVSVDADATLTVQQDLRLGSLAGAGTVDVQATQLGVGGNGGSTRFDGRLTGRGGLAKWGNGMFTLAGRNDLTGDVQVAAGRLQLDGAGVLPETTGIAVNVGATLALLSDQALGALDGAGQVALGAHTLTLGASGRSSRFDGVIGGSGSLVKQGLGTLGLGAANLYTGSTRVSGGTLALHEAQALHGASTLAVDAGASLQVNADQAIASLSGAGALALNARLALGAGGADSRFDGVASGSGGLVKRGGGTLTLTALQRNNGATTIEAGSVVLTAAGSLGDGEIRNQGVLKLERDDALRLDQAITGAGSLLVARGQVTLANAGNAYTGATDVQGGSLVTTGAERLPDASAVRVATGAQLQLGGAETIAALQAAGSVRLAGHLTTQGEQVYTGSLTLTNPAGLTLSGSRIDASASTNQFGGAPLGLNGGQALITAKDGLVLGDVTLSGGGRIEAPRLQLEGALKLSGGSLSLVASAAPDDAKATPHGTAQVPVAGLAMATAEATVQQGASGAITVDEGAKLQVHASGGGSVLLGQDANDFKGQLVVLSGASFNTAWSPHAKGQYAVQSLVRVAGRQVLLGDAGIEADVISIRADKLGTADSAQLVARLPFDEIVLGRALSAPGLTLELAPGAFAAGSFGSINGQPVRIEVGTTQTGSRTTGPNAGWVTVLPKGGAQGATVIVLAGPKVGSAPPSGGPGYRFFHDGASQATEVPVIYNGVLPLTPSASGAISSINGDAEDARRARFQETVRTENVTVRLRSGVIAEVGPGRPSTQGSEGAAPPVQCDPATQPLLSCK